MQKESVAVCKMTGSQAQTLQERDDVLRVEKDSTMKANGKRHKRSCKDKTIQVEKRMEYGNDST